MDDELHELYVEVDGFDEPLKLHGGFDGYDDPYQALAKYGFFKQKRTGRIRVGGAHIQLAFTSDPVRRDE